MRRRIIDNNRHAFFVTFSCYHRRKLLDDDRAKGIVVHFLSAQLMHQSGACIGFVIMPDHVHAMVRFQKQDTLSTFMGQWKRRSSLALKNLFQTKLTGYGAKIDLDGPMWQPVGWAELSEARQSIAILNETPRHLNNNRPSSDN